MFCWTEVGLSCLLRPCSFGKSDLKLCRAALAVEDPRPRTHPVANTRTYRVSVPKPESCVVD